VESTRRFGSAIYRPLALVLGNCVYHVGRQKMGLLGGWKNKEMDVYTQCLYEARELAMSRMQAEAEQVGAQVVAIGTAATSLSDTHEYPQPQVVVSVDNRM